jgi:hypothetical protein
MTTYSALISWKVDYSNGWAISDLGVRMIVMLWGVNKFSKKLIREVAIIISSS